MNFKTQTVKPILFMVFNRPEKTARVWEQIRKAKPQKLYISVDGPREYKPDDAPKCEAVKRIVEKIDWDCDVKRLYHEKNLGCTMAGKTAFDWVFSQEDEMIQIEDDVVPTQSFFWFMQEMLEKYKDNKQVCYVCAENYGIKSRNATYFFSRYGGSWGWATWKRVYDLWEYKLESLEEYVNQKSFINTFSSKIEYLFWKRKFFNWKYKGGNTYDLQTIYLIHKMNMVNIVPNVNLITNIGWDTEASNTLVHSSTDPSAIKFGNIKSFEIDEIIHPSQITISDKIDRAWFKYHFQGERSELNHRLRWAMSSQALYPLKMLLRPIYRKYFKRNN
jgi:hypothetical protein